MAADETVKRSMRLYDESGGDIDDAIRCAHCGGEYCHPTNVEWLRPVGSIETKDTVFGNFCGYLGCEFCPGVTAVFLMFHKGNTWLHTVKMQTR